MSKQAIEIDGQTGEIVESGNIVVDIAKQEGDVETADYEVEQIKEDLESELEKSGIYQRIKEIDNEKKDLQEQLKTELMQNKEYNDLAEQLAEAKRRRKVEKQTLSTLLVKYIAERKFVSVEVDGVQRKIDYTAKLGKELDRQQELPL